MVVSAITVAPSSMTTRRSEEHTSELQSHRDLHSFPTRRSSDLDSVHSQVGFAVKHMVVNTVHGRFGDYSGTIIYDDKDITKSSVNVTIKSASINTDNAQRDGHLKSPD